MSLLASFIPVATDDEGRTIPDALLYTYATGTYTPQATYSNVGLTVPNANPLEADGAGRFYNIYFGAGGMRLVLKDSFGNTLWQQDNYYPSLTSSDLTNINTAIANVSQQLSQTFLVCEEVGAADAYVLNPLSIETAPTAYSDGMLVSFIPSNANTGASTVNVSGLGNKALLDSLLNPLTANFLLPGTFYQFIYILGAFVFYARSGQVVTSNIQDMAVTTAKINSAAVTKAKMANGTAYTLLGYDSGGAPTEYTNGQRLLASGNITSAANLNFVLSTLDPSQAAGNSYLIRLIGFQPATDDVELWAKVSSDAGSTWLAGATYYSSATGINSGGTTRTEAQAAAAYAVIMGASNPTASFSNTASEVGNVDIVLTNMNTGASVAPMIRVAGGYQEAGAGIYLAQTGGGNNTTTADYDAFQLIWEGGGNFTAVGRYYIFKVT